MEALRLIVLYGEGAGIAAMVEPLKRFAAQDGIEVVDTHPSNAVACGAALLAQASAAGQGAPGALPTCAHDLGVTVFDRKSNAFLVERLIARGTALPASARKTVYTNRADQKRVVIQVAQIGGEDGAAVDLGVFEFGPIAAPRKNYPVEVTLSYDADGIVMVSAVDPETGARMEQVLGAEGGEHANWILRQRTWVADLQVND